MRDKGSQYRFDVSAGECSWVAIMLGVRCRAGAQVSHALVPEPALPQHRNAVAGFVEAGARQDPSGAEMAFPGAWWAAADPAITGEIRILLTSKGYLMNPPASGGGVVSFVDPWRMSMDDE